MRLCGVGGSGPKGKRSASRGVGISTDLDYMEFVDAKWQGTTVTICRTGYTGELGYELLPYLGTGTRAWDALLSA